MVLARQGSLKQVQFLLPSLFDWGKMIKEKCTKCEKYLFSECKGMEDSAPDSHIEVCFIEDIYNTAADEFLDLQRRAYSKDPGDWTPEECEASYLRAICGGDVMLHGTNSTLFPLWNLTRSISVYSCLEIYKILNVNLTLGDTKGESFYAGIPPVSANDIRKAKKVLESGVLV